MQNNIFISYGLICLTIIACCYMYKIETYTCNPLGNDSINCHACEKYRNIKNPDDCYLQKSDHSQRCHDCVRFWQHYHNYCDSAKC